MRRGGREREREKVRARERAREKEKEKEKESLFEGECFHARWRSVSAKHE